MDALYAVFRIVHVVAAAFWFGAAVTAIAFVEPAARATAPDGQKVMQALMRGGYRPAISAAGGLTVLAGAVLYWRASGGLQATAWVFTPVGLAWTVGGLAGLAAFVLGLAVTAPTAARMGAIGGQIQAQGGPPTPEQRALLGGLQARMRTAGWGNVALLTVALVLMAAARAL